MVYSALISFKHNIINHCVLYNLCPCIDSSSLLMPLSALSSSTLLPFALQALAMAEVNGPGPQVAEPQIAMYCGRQLLHMNIQTGQWEPDPQGRQGCFKEPSEILSYCQEVRSPEPHQGNNILYVMQQL